MAAVSVLQVGVPELPGWLTGSGAIRTAAALVVLAIGYYLSGIVVHLIGRRAARRFGRPSVTRTVLRSVRTFVFLLAVLVALVVANVPVGDVVLPVTVFSAVIAVILAPIVGSLISGLFVLADQPYEIGDLVAFSDVDRRGYVEDITLRYTKVFTLENTFLVIPNSEIRTRDIINYSAEDERTRLSLPLLVTYESDVDAARDIMVQAAIDTPETIDGGPEIRIGSARYPAEPRCYIDEYADHGVLLTLRYWVKTPYYMPRVRSKVNERVWDGIEDADVSIAYPHSHLVFDETSGNLDVDVVQGSERSSEDV